MGVPKDVFSMAAVRAAFIQFVFFVLGQSFGATIFEVLEGASI